MFDLDCPLRGPEPSGLAPGALAVEKRRVLVGTGTTALELVRVQPHGKKEMTAADWGRGLHAVPTGFDGTR